MNVIQLFKNNKAQKRRQEREQKEQFLQEYFSRLYEKNDAGKVEIPFFIKAQQTVDELKANGLLDDVFKHIQKRGLAC